MTSSTLKPINVDLLKYSFFERYLKQCEKEAS